MYIFFGKSIDVVGGLSSGFGTNMSPNLTPFLPSLAGAFDCDNDYYESFIFSPIDALMSCLKNNIKIYIRIYIKTPPKCFDVTVTLSAGSVLICAY